MKHACSINQTDDLYCWGFNMAGQLATPYLNARVPFGRASKFVKKARDISVGELNTCATSVDGEAYCWGASDTSNGFHMYGDPLVYSPYAPAMHQSLDVNVATLRMGYGISCVIKTDDTAWCWGTNAVAQTNMAPDHFYTSEAEQVYPGAVYDVSSGADHVCVVAKPSRQVYCRGFNDRGQLGDGTFNNSINDFVQVANLSNVERISSSVKYTCALTVGGSIYCWGTNGNLQLGSSVGATSSTAQLVPGVPLMKIVDAGRLHACGVTKVTGEVYCWGSNVNGQMGIGTASGLSAPVKVANTGITGVTMLAAGGLHTCARTATGATFCWGTNSFGQFANGAAVNVYPSAFNVYWGATSTFFATTESNSCYENYGFIFCAGSNIGGALGNRNPGSSGELNIVYVENLEVRVAEIGFSFNYYEPTSEAMVSTCALLKSPGAPGGAVFCWGAYGYGIGQKAKGTSTPHRLKYD